MCDLQDECYFYKTTIPQQNRMGEIYRERYCEGDTDLCARLRVSRTVGKEFVPITLYPHMQEVADQIIRQNTKKPSTGQAR